MLTVSGLELIITDSMPELAQREGGLDAAVVELDPLADAVGAAADDDDLRAGR